jgi:hypothetical protein
MEPMQLWNIAEGFYIHSLSENNKVPIASLWNSHQTVHLHSRLRDNKLSGKNKVELT